MPWGKECFPRVRVADKLPVVLSPDEVELFFSHIGTLKHRAALMLCYGAGLRISEAVKIRVSDIDSKRMLIRVEEGKGTQRPLCDVVAPPADRRAARLLPRVTTMPPLEAAPRLSVRKLARRAST